MTGATGFLGRYLLPEWLQRMELVDGTLICLVRANSDEDARQRFDKTFDSGDPPLLAHFQELAADHLQVIAGDKGEAKLGLDQQTWQRLADTASEARASSAVQSSEPAVTSGRPTRSRSSSSRSNRIGLPRCSCWN